MAKTGKSCYGCGAEQTKGFLSGKNFTLYYCKAPHCSSKGVLLCESCLVHFGAKSEFFGGLVKKCPNCKIGVLGEE